MSAIEKTLYAMRCDFEGGCSSELETHDGGAWLYDSPEEAREAAEDFDWVAGQGGKDYCGHDHAPADVDGRDAIYRLRRAGSGPRPITDEMVERAMTIEQEARNEATRRAWDGELSHTDRDGFRARIDASEAFERGYIAGASRPVTDEMVEAAARASFEHLRASRPADHGPYPSWEEEREDIARIIDGHVDMPVSSRLRIARSLQGNGYRKGAISAHRFTNAFGPEEVTRMRAALEAAMAVNRG